MTIRTIERSFQEAILNCYPGVEVVFAIDGIPALEALNTSSSQPDVIFLDYNMPRMTDIDCMRILKGQANTMSIPIYNVFIIACVGKA